MRILTIDLGTHTGWAARVDACTVLSGVQHFTPRRFEGGGMRFLRFSSWLAEIARTVGSVQAVYFEEVRRHVSTDSAHVYGGMLAVLTAWCEVNKIPYQGVPVGTIKKHATGKGNADKAKMIAAAQAIAVRWAPGIRITDDNEADALCLLDWALRENDLPTCRAPM